MMKISDVLAMKEATVDPSPKRRYWMGTAPTKCDLCEKPLDGMFIDGKTKMGPWANMCRKCFKSIGTGLGQGYGQKYEQQSDGKWLKIQG